MLEPMRQGQTQELRDETVVLVHGIWMQSVLMQPLAWRLRQHGYRTRCVNYSFLSKSPAENAQQLLDILPSIQTPTVHWVAHSLGGIVWLHSLHSKTELPPGRTVLLGSPVRGSEAAMRLYKKRWLRPLLGRSVEAGLLGGAPLETGARSVGLIRGGGWFSLSRLLFGQKQPSDGVVLHSETELLDALPVVDVPRSHSLMLFSAQTAREVAMFLNCGEFSNTG